MSLDELRENIDEVDSDIVSLIAKRVKIAAEVGNRVTVLMDSGVRSGLDVVRALALGAKAAFAGKAFLYGLGAIGGDGAAYVIDLFKEEVREVLRQVGVNSAAAATSIEVRHPGVWRF